MEPSQEEEKQMREDNDMNGKDDSCCIDGNSKSINPIKDAGAGGTGSGEGEVEGLSSSKNKGKSCKGCLYYSSTFKSNSRNPLCLGLSRSLPQGSPSNPFRFPFFFCLFKNVLLLAYWPFLLLIFIACIDSCFLFFVEL